MDRDDALELIQAMNQLADALREFDVSPETADVFRRIARHLESIEVNTRGLDR